MAKDIKKPEVTMLSPNKKKPRSGSIISKPNSEEDNNRQQNNRKQRPQPKPKMVVKNSDKRFNDAANKFEQEKARKEALAQRRRGRKQGRVRGSGNIIRKYSKSQSTEKIDKLIHSNIWNVYTDRLVHWIDKGWGKNNLVFKLIKSNTFVNSNNKIYTTRAVKVPIVLYSFPDFLPIGWLEQIRDSAEGEKNKYNRANGTMLSVAVNRVMSSEPSDTTFSGNKKYMRDYDNLVRQYEINASVLKDDTIKERDKQKTIGEDLYRKLQTYEWIRSIEENKDDSFWNQREFLEITVSGGSGQETAPLIQDLYKAITRQLDILQIKYKDLYQTVQNYYDGFSPIGHGETRRNYLFKKFLPQLRSARQMLSPTLLRQGSISDDYGVPVGIDIYAEAPLFIDYADNNLPPSTFLFASSGSGKTFLVQTMLVGFLQQPDLFFPIIIDWKNEYVELGRSSGMQIISNSPSEGLYFSTIELPEPTGDFRIDEKAKDNALRSTENVFELLLGEEFWNAEGTKSAFNFVRASLYRRHGVLLGDSSTWTNSRGLNYFTFYAEIGRILTEDRGAAFDAVDNMGSDNSKPQDVYKKMQEKLSDYFEKNGSKASFFKKAVRMEEINNSRGVIFALDRDQESVSGDSDIRLDLAMQFIINIINNLTNRKEHEQRLITIFYEETNRLLLLPKIAGMISGLTSSGRSRGIRNFFITNSPGQVLRMSDDDKTNQFTKVDPGVIDSIVSNVGSVIVGPNKNDAMSAIAEKYNMTSDNQINLLRLLMQQESKDNSDDSVMAHKFLIMHRSKTTLIEAISSPALKEIGLFGTETKVKRQTRDLVQDKKVLMDELLNGDKRGAASASYDTRKKIETKVDDTRKTRGSSLIAKPQPKDGDD